MALSGYFNGVTYDETFLARRVAALIPNGVYDGELRVEQYVGMQVKVDFGRAWINGYFYDSSRDTQEIVLDVPTADGSQPRVDAVMLRMNLVEKAFAPVLVAGTPGSNPAAPGVVRDGVTYDLKLAEISVPAGIASITTAQIHDTRPDVSVCGYTAGFKSIDMGALMAEYQAQFAAWFANLQDQLDENQAGNLQNQIDTHTSRTDNPHGVTAAQVGAIPAGQKGATGGVASLGTDGIVPLVQQGIVSGSNANGSYIKYPNGTMICHNLMQSTTISVGEWKDVSWTFPVEFIGNYTALCTVNADTTTGVVSAQIGWKSGAMLFIHVKNGSTQGSTPGIHVVAFGRWK